MTAASALVAAGTLLVSATELNRALGLGPEAWPDFGRHWDELRPDRYAAELGTCRLRRYGRFHYDAAEGGLEQLPHAAFVQPDRSNVLYVGRDRWFAPLTASFATDPVLGDVIGFLGALTHALDDAPRWLVNVTPFRVIAAGDTAGDPAPEGIHRDGVTLVSSLLVGRCNAAGGQSAVYDAESSPIFATTLTEPGSLLVGDDRRTLHGVTPIRPLDPGRPAYRDVLVVTFAPEPVP